MLPWSVTATARMPAAATRLTRSFTFTAPSSSEYCEWTWRWTKSGMGVTSSVSTSVAGSHPSARLASPPHGSPSEAAPAIRQPSRSETPPPWPPAPQARLVPCAPRSGPASAPPVPDAAPIRGGGGCAAPDHARAEAATKTKEGWRKARRVTRPGEGLALASQTTARGRASERRNDRTVTLGVSVTSSGVLFSATRLE